MTRINVGIDPKDLIDQHLLAELRELPRIPTLTTRRIKPDPNDPLRTIIDLSGIPAEFTLGAGHVKFFYDKIRYLMHRYSTLLKEYKFRYRKPYSVPANDFMRQPYPVILLNDYTPSVKDSTILAERILSRIETMKTPPRYFGIEISLNELREVYSHYNTKPHAL